MPEKIQSVQVSKNTGANFFNFFEITEIIHKSSRLKVNFD